MKNHLLCDSGIPSEIGGCFPGNRDTMARFIHTSRGKASSRPNPYNSTQSATLGSPEPSAAPAAPLREEGMPRGRDRERLRHPSGSVLYVCVRHPQRSVDEAPPRIRTRSVPVSERRNPFPQVLPEPAETADNALDPGDIIVSGTG